MRVLLISDTLHAGGAETFVLRLATKLNELGVFAEVLSLNPDVEDSELVNQFSGLIIHRIHLPLVRWVKRFDKVLNILKFDFSLQAILTKQAIKQKYLHYDIYHTHLFPVDSLFSHIKKSYPDVKIVSTLHGDYNEFDEYWDESSSFKKLHWPLKIKFIKNKIDIWVYISKQQFVLFRHKYLLSEDRLFKIYNGYDSNKVVPSCKTDIKEGGLTFIMVARGIQPKGWEYLIKAFNLLKGNHKLVLVGKGIFLENLKKENAANKKISFTGFHPSPIELINEADVFVFPSVYKSESLPTVVIEALYCGLPVISTRIGEIPEMLISNTAGELAGILIERDNEEIIIQSLYDAMCLYIQNKSLLRQHSTLARLAFDKFNMDNCTRSYIKLYDRLINKNIDTTL